MVKDLTWPTVVLVIGLGILGLALLTLTDLSSGEVLGILGVLGGIGGGAAVAKATNGGVRSTVEAIRDETQNQTSILQNVDRRTDGDLDTRIEAAVMRAQSQIVGALRQEGARR